MRTRPVSANLDGEAIDVKKKIVTYAAAYTVNAKMALAFAWVDGMAYIVPSRDVLEVVPTTEDVRQTLEANGHAIAMKDGKGQTAA